MARPDVSWIAGSASVDRMAATVSTHSIQQLCGYDGWTGRFSALRMFRLKLSPVQRVTKRAVPLSLAIAAKSSAVNSACIKSAMAMTRATWRR